MTYKFTNNASGRLTSSVTAAETTLVLGGTEGDLFPSLLPGETFQATLVDEDGNREIVLVTSRTTNTLTVERAQEGTLPRSFAAGTLVSHRLTAAALTQFAQREADNVFSGEQSFESANIGGQLKLRGDAEETCWTIDVGDGPPDPNPDSILGHNLQLKRYDANGNVLDQPISIDRTTGKVSTLGRTVDAFDAGTRMLFQQTAAPTGWTKITEHNNKALRVVSGAAGSGGTTAFTSVFTNRTITQANLPDVVLNGSTNFTGAHNHTYVRRAGNIGADGAGGSAYSTSANTNTATSTDGNHQHTVTVELGGSGTPMDFAVQYVDIIIAEKD